MRPEIENPNKRRIRQAAFALMYERGFTAASYSDIAARAGVGRPLVQRHFPKKEQFVLDMIERATELCKQTLREHDGATTERVLRALHFLQLYQTLVLVDDAMAHLTRDVIANRDLTGAVIDAHWESTFQYCDGGAMGAREAAVRVLGGTYELMTVRMAAGEPLDAGSLAAQTMAAFLALTVDESYTAAHDAMTAALLPEAQVKAWARAIRDELIGRV